MEVYCEKVEKMNTFERTRSAQPAPLSKVVTERPANRHEPITNVANAI